jgi:hypothetical protein
VRAFPFRLRCWTGRSAEGDDVGGDQRGSIRYQIFAIDLADGANRSGSRERICMSDARAPVALLHAITGILMLLTTTMLTLHLPPLWSATVQC